MTALIRKTALTLAGAAVLGGAFAGPATSASAAERPGGGARELNIRYEAQPNFYYCGPAAARNALTAVEKAPSQDEAAKEMGTTEAGTDSANDITRFLNTRTGDGTYRTVELGTPKADDAQTDRMRADIVATVDDGRAVVANIAGTATDTDGVGHSFPGGHYVSVVGYRDNGDTVKIPDSARPDRASYWMTIETLADWTSTRGYSS